MASFRALSIVKSRFISQLRNAGEIVRPKSFKIGFLGTLDPMACGVLVLLLGKATKLTNQLHTGAKVYRSIFTFGVETDTLDDAGVVTATSTVIPTREQIKNALRELTGDVEIVVPKFSAVHIDGVRAYDLARRGENFIQPTKIVNVARFELTDFTQTDKKISGHKPPEPPTEFFFEIECNAGTYIRSLAQILAKKLGTVAIASLIIRTRTGDYTIENAKNIDTVSIADVTNLFL